MSRFAKILVVSAAMLAATNVWAIDEESFVEYDAIVNELKASADHTPAMMTDDLDWEDVAITGGMSLVTSYVHIVAPNGMSGSGLLKGFEAHGGANLFTKKARAELAFRNFAPEEFRSTFQADLKEFEARVVLLPALRDKLLLRMGFGLTVRYMDINTRNAKGSENFSSSAAASSMLVGMEHRLSKAVLKRM